MASVRPSGRRAIATHRAVTGTWTTRSCGWLTRCHPRCAMEASSRFASSAISTRRSAQSKPIWVSDRHAPAWPHFPDASVVTCSSRPKWVLQPGHASVAHARGRIRARHASTALPRDTQIEFYRVWFRNQLAEYARYMLSSLLRAGRGYADPAWCRRLLRSGRLSGEDAAALGRLVTLELVHARLLQPRLPAPTATSPWTLSAVS